MQKSIYFIFLSLLNSDELAWALPQDKTSGSAKTEIMVVTGTRTKHGSWDAPIPTESLSVEDARKRGKQSLADVLADQPGVEVVPGLRGQSIRLQGFDSKYVLILVDGQRVTGKVGESFDLESISVDQIERVEVVRGAVSSLYGSDGIGGVVNIITRRPRHGSLDLRLRWGTDEATALGGQLSQVGESSDNTLSFNASREKPWRRTSSPATQLSGAESGEISWQNNWNISQDVSLKTRLAYQNSRVEGTDLSAAGAIWDRENAITRSSVQLSPEKLFDNGSILKVDAQLQTYEDTYETVARLQKSERNRELTKERLQEYTLSYQHELGASHVLTWGLTYIDEYLESDRVQGHHVDRQRQSLFAQDEWAVNSDLSIVPGFRMDDDSQFGDHASGKLALRQALSNDTILRASYGEGYRAPSFKELHLRFENLSVGYDVIGFPELQPETSKSYQLALDHNLNEEQGLSLKLFQNEIGNLISTITREGSGQGIQHYTYRNIAKAMTRGADASWRWTGSRFETQITYQYLEARDRTLDRVLEGRSRDTLAFQISQLQLSDSLRLHLSGRWMGPQTFYLTETKSKSDSAFIASVGGVYDWDRSWATGMTIENLANSWEDRILQVRPRSYVLTLNWHHQNQGKD